MLSHLKLLFWKQRVNFRADLSYIIAITVLPAILLVLASTNSGSITKTAKSNELIECKIDNFLYCNYPMSIAVESSIRDQYYSDTDGIKSTFEEALSNVAMALGSDIDTIFKTDDYVESETTKDGGSVEIDSFESASVFWYNGENNVFAQNFVNLANQELEKLENTIRFQEGDNPYEYEASGGFDLRVGTFLLLLRAVGNEITRERSSNMYHYMTRTGLLQSAFWTFQYIWWMIVATLSIGITAIVALLLEMDVDIGAYFVSAWWHITLAVFLGTIFKEKKYFDLATIAILIIGFALPITFSLALPKTPESENIIDGVYCIPLFFVIINSVSSFQILVGSIISVAMMLVSAYLVPILCVSDGYYAGGKINFLYFLTPGFWKEGIVAVPMHDRSCDEDVFEGNSTLSFKNCVKRFAPVKKCFKKELVEEKVIGPMNLDIEVGKITTLLGHNGVGKSTLLKVAAGYFIPSEGEMLLGDINIFRERPWSCLKSISFCPQDNLLYENMTIEEHLILITSLRDMTVVGNVQEHIDWVLSTLDIANKKATLAKNLSGGMKRRLCLAMAVAGFPRFILCDEPSSGVDSITQRGIWKLLETAKNKSAIVLTSHAPLEAVILSNSVVWMESSEEISHTDGVQKMAFTVKNEVENSTQEYEISSKNTTQVANVITSLPESKRDWKISSKRLNSGHLPPLEDLLEYHEEENLGSDPVSSLAEVNSVPESLGCEPPSFWRQVLIMISTIWMHPDRAFFLIFFGLPINGACIYVAIIYRDFDDMGQLIITPLVPMIGIISSSIITIQLTEIFAREKSLGITKLLMSQGITLPAYLFAYISLYFFMSFPVSVGFMISIGFSSYGTSTGMFALFVLYFSFFVMMISICCALGAVLDANIATTITFIAPSLFGIFGQGSTSQTFANMYPGSLSQVMAGLLINHVSKKEWGLYAMTIVINLVIGSFCSYVFILRMRNSSSSILRNCGARSGKTSENLNSNDPDIENELMPNNDVLLEGRQIVKTYAVGENSSDAFRALDNVTFSIQEGSLLGLVGKSGAGKSTLMDVLSGQLKVSSGSVLVEGKKTEPTEISKVVSMCGQLDTVWPTINVISAIKIFLKCRGHRIPLFSKLSDPYVLYLIERLGLEDTLNKKVKSLSGGQKRKLAFLFSLFGKTKVVLVDEAMTGVDIETRQIMWRVLQDEITFRGRSVVVTSHDMGEVEQYCNTIGILHDGKLVEMGKLDDIKKKWGDSVKLICLIEKLSSVSVIETAVKKKLRDIIIDTPALDILNEINESRTVVTFEMNLISLKNISALIEVMNNNSSIQSEVLYWSIEPQVLDDFVREKARKLD